MDYYDVHVLVNDLSFIEILEAELAELPFESFQSEGVSLHAYIPSNAFDQESIEGILNAYSEHIVKYEVSLIQHRNWNQVWETSYEPVFIGDEIIIKAPFHNNTPKRQYEITLDPNMSFGTGHHPTTFMMLEALQSLKLSDKRLCDFGCGSGILDIYASLRGASGIGIEIDPHAAEAAQSNLKSNNCERFEVRTGGIEQLSEVNKPFDLILANINRNIIEESLSILSKHLKNEGYLLCAGFLDGDAQDLIDLLEMHGFQLQNRRSRDGWTMLATQKAYDK